MGLLGSLLRRIPFVGLLLPKPGPDVPRVRLPERPRVMGHLELSTDPGYCCRCGKVKNLWAPGDICR